MKKLLALFVVCVMTVALSTTVLASKIGDYRGEIPKVAEGEIVVDGTIDDVYKHAFQTYLNKVYAPDKETGTYGKAYLMWSDGKLYIYITVTDAEVIAATPDLQEATPYITDSAEIFLDLGNEHTLPLVLARCDYSGFPSYYIENSDLGEIVGADCDQYMTYAAKWTNTGYNIEMCVDLSLYVETEEGFEIGLNLMINDMTSANAGKRTACILMPSKLNAKDWHIDNYDYVKLGAAYDPDAPVTELVMETEPVTTEEPATAEVPVEEEPEETEAPKTEPEETEEPETESEKAETSNDPSAITEPTEEPSFPVVTVVIIAVALIAVIAVIVILKKKK